MKKRITALISAIAVAATMLSGCSGNEAIQSGENQSSESGEIHGSQDNSSIDSTEESKDINSPLIEWVNNDAGAVKLLNKISTLKSSNAEDVYTAFGEPNYAGSGLPFLDYIYEDYIDSKDYYFKHCFIQPEADYSELHSGNNKCVIDFSENQDGTASYCVTVMTTINSWDSTEELLEMLNADESDKELIRKAAELNGSADGEEIIKSLGEPSYCSDDYYVIQYNLKNNNSCQYNERYPNKLFFIFGVNSSNKYELMFEAYSIAIPDTELQG